MKLTIPREHGEAVLDVAIDVGKALSLIPPEHRIAAILMLALAAGHHAAGFDRAHEEMMRDAVRRKAIPTPSLN